MQDIHRYPIRKNGAGIFKRHFKSILFNPRLDTFEIIKVDDVTEFELELEGCL